MSEVLTLLVGLSLLAATAWCPAKPTRVLVSLLRGQGQPPPRGADGLLPRRVEGLTEARWILMDYLDVIVHIFTPEARDYYRLEQLWGEAPRHAIGA